MLFAGCLQPDEPADHPDGTGAPEDKLLTELSAASGLVTIVATKQIQQDWGQSAWSAGSIVLPGVQTNDTIVVCGLYWISSGPSAAPSDSRGVLTAAVNQAPLYGHPPVAAQIYYQLHAAAGTHTITPPNLAYGGDGTFYVLQVRGLTGSLVGAAHNHADGSALFSIATQLPSAASVGDFVVAVGGEDDAVAYGTNAGMSAPPAGWQSIGVQNNANVNVPSAAYSRSVASAGSQPVSWRWNDTTANVTGAAIAAFR